MAKPLLTNNNTGHHLQHQHQHQHHLTTLISLTKEEKSLTACANPISPPRLIFTSGAAIQSANRAISSSASGASIGQNADPQAIAPTNISPPAHCRSSSNSSSSSSSAAAAAAAAIKKQPPVLVSTTCHPLRPPLASSRRSSSDAAPGANRQTKLSQHSASVINRSTAPPTGCETGNVAARLLDMGKRLLDAAREGHTDHVRQLVVGSGAPFTSDWLGTTALHLAAQFGHAEIADILLRGGVNRDARTKLERTALHLAAQSGSLPVVESLLIHGSDVNASDMLKMTPLHWAVERRHLDIVKRLLVGGADVNIRSKFQLTPLDIAQNSGCYEIVELLKNWTDKDDCDLGSYNDCNHQSVNNPNKFYESHDIFNDVNYQLMIAENNGATSRGTSMLDIDEPCIDLVELEWSSLKFEGDFSHLSNHTNDNNSDVNDREQKPCELECLMKMVEELQRENEQLRKRLEQISNSPSNETR